LPQTKTNAKLGGGQIITFYSFKGGVGRTMALANIAFLAAVNGKRVLVMDWDLEAPGLHYYFRGMQDTAASRAIRTAPGVLDLVWSWSAALRGATTAQQTRDLVAGYRSGKPFSAMACSLIPEFDGDDIGTLHHIGAGGSTVLTPEPLAYEEALARFDWSTFFSDEAGGLLLTALRDWAKEHYDYVFLDSRTGFADVAGICTMQIPDQVALCYIYNRQNIDGIAQVAGAIRSRRGEEVTLRGVPMRVSRENTSEEADARARARRELARRGGFSSDAVEHDQKVLAVRQAPNVPFYESVAMITSDRPRSDPLALDYLNLASQLLGIELDMPQLYEEWVARVRRRLQPGQVAPDYLLGLPAKDFTRAVEEVTQLLERALDDQMDGDEDEEYLHTLVSTVTHLSRSGSSEGDVAQMMSLTLDLLRALAVSNPQRWKKDLGDFITFYLEQVPFAFDDGDELLLLDELDVILAALPGDSVKFRRLENRRRAARLHLLEQHNELASQIVAELSHIIGDLSKAVTSETRLDLLAAEIDLQLLRGDIQVRVGKFESARRLFENGLKLCAADDRAVTARPDMVRLRFELHMRLARLPQPAISVEEAASHALNAIDWAGTSNVLVFTAIDLGETIVRANDPISLAHFIRRVFRPHERRQSQFVLFQGRSARGADLFVKFARGALEVFIDHDRFEDATVTLLLDTTVQILEMLLERRYSSFGRSSQDLREEMTRLIELIDAHPTQFEHYRSMLGRLNERLSANRSRPGG
jgi:hypothetical protein